MTNYPVFKENEKTGKYRVITWPTFGGADAVIQFNQTYKADADIGKLMATKDFRIALSEAINRDQIKESVFLGLGEARQGVPSPNHPYFPGDQYAKKYTQYKPDEANKLLDQLGLTKRDGDGTRLLPSGKRVVLELSVVPAFAAWPDVAQLVAKDWEKVGVKTVVQLRERALHFKMRDNNELMTEMWNEDTTGFPFTGNAKFDPRNSPILTLGPLYGRWAQTKGGAARLGQAHHGDRRSGQDGLTGAAGEAGAGAVPDLGRQPLGGRHDRPDPDGAGRGGRQYEVPERPDHARQ
jgi:peptide/nickel transport system substrate-binding protein